MSDILVSIIIPCYNAEKFIKETLDSICSQTYSNWECIIVDDGSTDSSREIALSYCEKDNRFRYYYQANSGPSAARNYGFRQSAGDYIQYLDADDVLLPERFKLLLASYGKQQDNIILYTDLLLGNNSNVYKTTRMRLPATIGRDITFRDMYEKFALEFLFVPLCILFPRKAIIKKKCDEKLRLSEDWDYYLSILNDNKKFRYYNIPLGIYRNTEDGQSKNMNKIIKSNYYILRRWVDKTTMFTFSRRCAQLYIKSILAFLQKKTTVICTPKFGYIKNSLVMKFFILLIYPLALLLFISEVCNILIRRTGRILK